MMEEITDLCADENDPVKGGCRREGAIAGAVSLSRHQGMDLCALGRRWPCTAVHSRSGALRC